MRIRHNSPRCQASSCTRPAHFHTIPTTVSTTQGAQEMDLCKAHLWHAFDRTCTVADPESVIRYEDEQ